MKTLFILLSVALIVAACTALLLTRAITRETTVTKPILDLPAGWTVVTDSNGNFREKSPYGIIGAFDCPSYQKAVESAWGQVEHIRDEQSRTWTEVEP